MSFMNPDFDKLPERVQAVLDGNCSAEPCCSQCRTKGEQLPASDETAPKMLRCSRCQVARYCSRNCQKEHFAFHKPQCKSIHQQRTQIEQAQEQIHAIGFELEQDKANYQSFYAMTAALMMKLGDDLVVMGYRETDTIANGVIYYCQALHYYFEMRKLIRGTFFDEKSPMDDKVLMLLVVLGGDSNVIMEWCTKSGSRRFGNFLPPTEENAPPRFRTQGLAGNDLLFQALSMLVSMRSLAEYRRNLRAFEAFKQLMQELPTGTIQDDARRFHPLCEEEICSLIIYPYLMGPTQEGQIHMDILPDEIRLVISAIRHHGHGTFLRHLRDDIPLSPEHAPTLLRGSGVRSNGDEDGNGDGTTTPAEFWHLYQDCFFLTLGLNDVLNEFLPEEDDDNDDEDA